MMAFLSQAARMAENGIPLPANWLRISYFHCSLMGYFLGLLTATISSEVTVLAFFESDKDIKILSFDFFDQKSVTNLNISGVQGCPASPALPCAFHTLPPLRHGLAQGRLQDLCSLLSPKFPFQGDLRSMWSDPFVHVPPAKYQAI